MKRLLCIAILLVPFLAVAQQIPHDSLWLPMKYFIGSWVGDGEGQAGISKHERNFQWALNGNFIQIRSKEAYAPQPKSPEGEIHEDLGYINYNSVQKKFMLRQFHVEGYVKEYKLETISADKKTFVFISFEIENIPNGWRARETFQILSEDEYVETFELAAPGKEFTVYSKANLKRRKPPRYTG